VSEVDMLGPLDIHQYLLAHDVHHEIVRLPRPIASADHLREALGVPAARCLAVHPFRAGTPAGDVLVLVLSPSDATFDLPTLAANLAELLHDDLGPTADLTPAKPDTVSSRTDYLAGHLAPLLLPADVIVVATQSVVDLANSIIYTASGDGGTALGIRATDLLTLSRAVLLPNEPPPGADTTADDGSLAPSAINLDADAAQGSRDSANHDRAAARAMGLPSPQLRASRLTRPPVMSTAAPGIRRRPAPKPAPQRPGAANPPAAVEAIIATAG
jgi:Cys-tRNA(Pro)/Cys-tRNA(Cys) deacylase